MDLINVFILFIVYFNTIKRIYFGLTIHLNFGNVLVTYVFITFILMCNFSFF